MSCLNSCNSSTFCDFGLTIGWLAYVPWLQIGSQPRKTFLGLKSFYSTQQKSSTLNKFLIGSVKVS